MSNKKRNSSLCEKSMKMVMSLGATGPSVVTKNPALVASSVMDTNQPLLLQIPGSRKSQELRIRKQPFSVVMQPNEGKGSSYVVHEDDSVIDGMTSDYIRKFHEKNRYDAYVHETMKFSPDKPFSPLRAVK
ncbi:conserved hypothetical protein [Ricinus communis]|uniref:Uncharacterized protein n=1 Tax=Ricinus communis TaxID=3988 RepID=B9R904_RICCO|nr:conserved hypothetical protein [Ricinus communis]